jgi:hypothetical protein
MAGKRIEHVEDRPARGATRAERPNRVPINGDVDILTVKGIRPGYHPCWVNEEKVPKYLGAGYTFVESDNVTFGSYHVNQGNPLGARYVRDVGMGKFSYLMEIPQEYYDEDRQAEQDSIDKAEEGMKQSARQSGLDHGDLYIESTKNRR